MPGCCWQVECSTSPQRTHELLVRRDASGGEGERGHEEETMVVEVTMVKEWGKGYTQKEEGMGPCDSDDPPCDFKYVHRLHASAVPRDVPSDFCPRARA